MSYHRARAGDCVYSIAAQYRLPWQRIWDHPENRPLVEQRSAPNTLEVGDVVYVPDRQHRQEATSTGRRVRYRARAPQVELRLQVEEFGEPRAFEEYWVEIDGVRSRGESPMTDADGSLTCRIPATARTALLIFGDEEHGDELEVVLGALGPANTSTGLQRRLANLGARGVSELDLADDSALAVGRIDAAEVRDVFGS